MYVLFINTVLHHIYKNYVQNKQLIFRKKFSQGAFQRNLNKSFKNRLYKTHNNTTISTITPPLDLKLI